MEIRKIKLFEITYKNDTLGEYFNTLAYNASFFRLMVEYESTVLSNDDSSLEFKVKEVEYEYIHKENSNDIVYYNNGITSEDNKYESLEELLKNNNFGEGLFEMYIYDSTINRSFSLDFSEDFQTDRVLSKKTLNIFTINANGINIVLNEQENGFTKKLN